VAEAVAILVCIWEVLVMKYSGDQIKHYVMGGGCGIYGGEEKCVQGFGGET
jgi:hypothetical protein